MKAVTRSGGVLRAVAVVVLLALCGCHGGGQAPLETAAEESPLSGPASQPAPVSQPERSPAKPILAIEPQDAYQRVYEETTALKFDFSVRNTANRTVRILQVRPSCSCTVVELGESTLEPGQKTLLSTVYDAASTLGELPQRKILLETDAPECPAVECSVAGFRQQRFVVQLASVDFGALRSGATPASEVTIEAHGDDMRLTPEKAIVNTPWVAAEPLGQEPLPGGGRRWKVRVSLCPKAPIGKIEGQLFIPRVEDDGIGPVVYVRGEVFGPVRLVPSTAFVGILAKGAIGRQTVRVEPVEIPGEAPGLRSVKILGFGDCPKGVRLGTIEADPAGVRVEVAASDLGPGSFSHSVVILCQASGNPCEVALKVSGMVEP